MSVMQIKYGLNTYIINNNSQYVQKNFGQKQSASSCTNRKNPPDDTLKTYYGIQQACYFIRIVNRLNNLKSPDIPSSALNYLVDTIKLIDDMYVQNEIKRLFQRLKKELDVKENLDTSQIVDLLIEIHTLIDAVNCATEKYCSTGSFDFDEKGASGTVSYYKKLKSKNAEMADRLSLSVRNCACPNFDSSDINPIDRDFINQQKYEKLKDYIADTSMGTNELKDHLYEKYYLSKIPLPEKIKSLSRKINKEFGTKVFYSAKTDFECEPMIIYNELRNWKRAGQNDFISPSIIDMNYADESFLGDAKGYMSYEKIVLRPDTNNTWLNLRHELAHLQDRYKFALPPNLRQVSDDILKNRTFEQELVAAGISKRHRDYAHTNKHEFLAVCATGNPVYYSKKLKEKLVELGLPEYVFSLPHLSQDNGFETMLDDM